MYSMEVKVCKTSQVSSMVMIILTRTKGHRRCSVSSSQDTETTICDNITGGGNGHYSVSVVHPINVKIESLKCFKLSKDLPKCLSV